MKSWSHGLLAASLCLSLAGCASTPAPTSTPTPDPENLPEIVKMPTSEKVEIDSVRGTKIQAVLDLPADMPEAGYPLVVFAHGFQGSKEESGAFTDAAKGLAEQGIASLRLDFPGCGESQEDFMAYTLENMHDDVASVFAYARANYKLDEDRIGMLGYSMGGRVTSLYLSEEKIGTTVLWAPAAADGLKSLTSMGDEETIRKLIEESADSGVAAIRIWNQEVPVAHDFLVQSAQAKPMVNLSAYTGSLMVVTGGQDNTVTKAITDPIFEAAVNTKITTHLDVPRGTHSLGAGEFGNDPDVQNAVVEATVHFFADQMK
ncbi:alpha/beta hydrolase family protein [Holdemania filiformis]|uniref:alpha/beta hydrolase family protein n=1 Tax=Holdemania filiformis TaxID=61171 RepID=UPI00210ADA64|nr:alpha/beta hydrolase [Holdemania filiformis]MCQ4953665.1 alpha/beta hydrolase [Holdemania filiformis]